MLWFRTASFSAWAIFDDSLSAGYGTDKAANCRRARERKLRSRLVRTLAKLTYLFLEFLYQGLILDSFFIVRPVDAIALLWKARETAESERTFREDLRSIAAVLRCL